MAFHARAGAIGKAYGLVAATRRDAGRPLVISTKAEGRVEKSGREWTTRRIRGQMSRLCFAPLDMTNNDTSFLRERHKLLS